MQKSNTFEEALAYHCAPTLFHIKAASLFSYQNLQDTNVNSLIRQYNVKFNKSEICIISLCNYRNSSLILAYNKKMLEKNLCGLQASELLDNLGYPNNSSVEEKLNFLKKRIEQQNEFPHEIGLFLGYPIYDVIGFIENGGKNYKLSGYWKVYMNEHSTKKLFDSYTKCRIHLYKKINSGMTIYQALHIA